mmetsp:Transcript_2489/g.7957  ORF Transcript_2489/g.7957 Transcript_2489/m.7957 type:complete len:334 (+) Transcript_2489:411-1412(+)
MHKVSHALLSANLFVGKHEEDERPRGKEGGAAGDLRRCQVEVKRHNVLNGDTLHVLDAAAANPPGRRCRRVLEGASERLVERKRLLARSPRGGSSQRRGTFGRPLGGGWHVRTGPGERGAVDDRLVERVNLPVSAGHRNHIGVRVQAERGRSEGWLGVDGARCDSRHVCRHAVDEDSLDGDGDGRATRNEAFEGERALGRNERGRRRRRSHLTAFLPSNVAFTLSLVVRRSNVVYKVHEPRRVVLRHALGTLLTKAQRTPHHRGNGVLYSVAVRSIVRSRMIGPDSYKENGQCNGQQGSGSGACRWLRDAQLPALGAQEEVRCYCDRHWLRYT